MAVWELTVDVDGSLDEMMLKLEEIGNPATWAGFLEEMVEPHFHEAIEEAFSGKHTPSSGEPWTPLAPSTELRRIQLGYTASDILIRTGDLHAFMTSQARVTETGEGAEWSFPPADAMSGDRQLKFSVAQTGTSKAPARPVLELTDQDEEEIMAMVEAKIQEILSVSL